MNTIESGRGERGKFPISARSLGFTPIRPIPAPSSLPHESQPCSSSSSARCTLGMCKPEKTIVPYIAGVSLSSFADCEPTTGSVSTAVPLPVTSSVPKNKSFLWRNRKSTLEDYLVSRHGFTTIHLESANHYVRNDHPPHKFSSFIFILLVSLVVRRGSVGPVTLSSIALCPIWENRGRGRITF